MYIRKKENITLSFYHLLLGRTVYYTLTKHRMSRCVQNFADLFIKKVQMVVCQQSEPGADFEKLHCGKVVLMECQRFRPLLVMQPAARGLAATRTQPISLHTQPPTPLCFAPQFRIPFRFAWRAVSLAKSPKSGASRKNENHRSFLLLYDTKRSRRASAQSTEDCGGCLFRGGGGINIVSRPPHLRTIAWQKKTAQKHD